VHRSVIGSRSWSQPCLLKNEWLAEYCWNGTVWNLKLIETVPLLFSCIYRQIEACDRLFWTKTTHWGFQPYSANLSMSMTSLPNPPCQGSDGKSGAFRVWLQRAEASWVNVETQRRKKTILRTPALVSTSEWSYTDVKICWATRQLKWSDHTW